MSNDSQHNRLPALLASLRPSRLTILWGSLLVLLEFLAVQFYLLLAPVEPEPVPL